MRVNLNVVSLCWCVALSSISGCASTSVVMLDSGTKYAPTSDVELLLQIPNRPFKKIALLESRGGAGVGLPELISSMKEQAKTVGADAVIPTGEASQDIAPGIIYNPWLGGYQTMPDVPVAHDHCPPNQAG